MRKCMKFILSLVIFSCLFPLPGHAMSSTMSVNHPELARAPLAATSAEADFACKLDTIDNVRQALSRLKGANGNVKFYEDLLAQLPQFVACGPQSTGKSSVIRRISGISLPESSTLCTRIATIIQMRREPNVSVEVCLQGPDGENCWSKKIAVEDTDEVKTLVTKAQDDALKKTGNTAQFVDDHAVLIKVYGPDQHSLTLVDLPGFHSSSDEDSKTVNELVKRYIEMPGTLAMHVVKGDQDYSSILGNDFMRSHKIDRVTVLTHCDKLDKSPECVSRFQDTLSKASDTSSMIFAVQGSATTQDEEDKTLQHLLDFQDAKFDIGAMSLGKHLEERMRQHLENQLPLAAISLQKSLQETTSQLQKMHKQNPSHLITTLMETIRENFALEKKVLMNKVRDQVHEMATDIKNYRFKSKEISESTSHARDEFDEDLEPGMTVYTSSYFIDSKLNTTQCHTHSRRVCITDTGVIDSLGRNCVWWRSISTSNHDWPVTGITLAENIHSGEVMGVDNIIEEIKELAQDRGIRNLMHVDRQPIIQVYANRFADHYTETFAEHGAVVQALVTKALDTSFRRNVDEAAQSVANQLRQELQDSVEQEGKTHKAFKMIKEHNSNPDLIFTTNEHYLNNLVQKMVAADKNMTSDTGSARHIYHNVRAFLKVQRKQVAELVAKELIRTAVLEVETSLKRLLADDMSDFHKELQEESPTIRTKREMLEKRETVLLQAVKLLHKEEKTCTRKTSVRRQNLG